MFPASTHKGQAVLGFPDVCKTPTPGGPVPIPYPNIGMTAGTTTKGARKVKIAGKTAVSMPAFKRSSGNEAGMLKGQLSALHQRLMTLPPGDTTAWHKALDNYVIKSAEVFEALSSND